MQIVNRQSVAGYSVRLVQRRTGSHYLVVTNDLRPGIVSMNFIAKDFDHAIRKTNRVVENLERHEEALTRAT